MQQNGSPPRSRGDRLAAIGILVGALLLPARSLAQPADQSSGGTTSAPEAPSAGLLPEPHFLSHGIKTASKFAGEGDQQRAGFYPDFSDMISGAGWISAGPGYRHWFGRTALLDTSAALSWRAYTTAQARFEMPNLANGRTIVGAQFLWQDATQISYFGIGPDTLDSQRSEYRMKTTDVVGYATLLPATHLNLTSRLGMLQSPRISEPSGWFKRGNPSAESMFPNDPVFLRGAQPDYLYAEISLTADTRNYRSHPTDGGVYRAGLASYSDRDGGGFSFTRYEAEAVHVVPLANRHLSLVGHGWFVSTVTDAGNQVPFYMMPTLGDGATLRSFTGYRFHDNDSLVLNVEARVPLMTHVDVAAFAGAGNVAPKVSGLNIDKREYGVGVRVHSIRSTMLRLDAAHGPEGWRVIFRQSDPFHLTRFKKRTATAPFVP